MAAEKPNPTLRDALGVQLKTQLESAIKARQALKARWDKTEAQYRVEPQKQAFEFVKGRQPRTFPLITPRVRRLVNATYRAIGSSVPMVQAVPEGRKLHESIALEKGMHTLAARASFEIHCRQTLKHMFLTGVGIMRLTLQENGFKYDSIHPNDFVVSPVYGALTEDCDITGHRFWSPVSRVKAMQAAGKYYKYEIKGGGSNPDSIASGRNPQFDRSDAAPDMGNTGSQLMELWSLNVRLKTTKGSQLFRIVFDFNESKVLLIEPYIYSRTNYLDFRAEDEYGKWWPSTSIGNELQSTQDIYSEAHNILIDGSILAAAPPVFVSGGLSDKKIQTYFAGQIIETATPVTLQQVPVQFNPGALPQVIQQIEKLADGTTGADQNATGQQLKGGTSATEAAELANSRQQNEQSFLARIAHPIEQMWALQQEMCVLHASHVRAIYGDALLPEFWRALDSPVRWEMTGKVPGNSTAIFAEKLKGLLDLAANEQSDLLYNEVEKAIVNAMQLPFDTERLYGRQKQMAAAGMAPAGPQP